MLAYWPSQLAAQSSNQAALVVRFGDGSVQTRCVTFEEAQISGYDLLLRAGLDVTADVQGAGALICAINDTGCAADNCLCHCAGGDDCRYWSYWLQNEGQWHYAQGGASMVSVRPGMVQGWSWGPGSVDDAIAPPALTFDAVCAADATAVPANTTTQTETPLAPTPTDTGETAVGWPAYAFFAALGIGLSLLIGWVNQRRSRP